MDPVGQVTFSVVKFKLKKPSEWAPRYFYLSEGRAHGHQHDWAHYQGLVRGSAVE